MSFVFRKDRPSNRAQPSRPEEYRPPINLPFGDVEYTPIQPKGCVIYNPKDGFVYISDGSSWDKISGVNNPVDILLPVSQNRVAKWSEEYPPGAGYSSPVLQDSSLEISAEGDGMLHSASDKLDSFPWTRGNFSAQGSISAAYCFGLSVDSEDPNNFIPILTQTKGHSYRDGPHNDASPRTSYDTGSIAIGHSAMEYTVTTGNTPRSYKNTIVGVGAGKRMSIDASSNIYIGWRAGNTNLAIDSSSNSISIGVNSTIHPNSKDKIIIGCDSSSIDDAPGTVCIGTQSKGSNANVIVGSYSDDGGYKNTIILGSGCSSLGPDRIVLGSGIIPISIDNAVPADRYLPVQLEDQLYYIPLLKENKSSS